VNVPFFAARNGSWIRSTPAFDGEVLVVAGMRDVLTCLDAETGEVRWRVDFVERFGSELPSFGFVCSPLIVGDHVYVLAGASLLKLDKATGETVWRQLEDAGGMDSAFSSPIVTTLAGKEQLVVQTRADLCGVDLDDGARLWSAPIRASRGMSILTPLPYGDAVFTSAYGGRSQLLAIDSTEGAFASSKLWEARGQGYMTSPVLIDGHAYLFLRSNRFTCIDLNTGEEKWTSPPTGDNDWSLVAQGDRILALSDNGRLYHIAANPTEYKVLSSVDLVENQTWAHLAMVGNQLFVRAQSSLIAYAWK
jgi:outer membrane protein assembly factor BamB